MSEQTIIHGDCLEELKKLDNNSVDSIVTDPPYGLSFMGKKWDYDVPSEDVWRECLRVLKPGGHLLVFAGTRTQHRMAVRIEDAGFEIRDMIAWIYGSGFPKSLNIGKAVDKLQGNERVSVPDPEAGRRNKATSKFSGLYGEIEDKTDFVTKGTSPWEGWGTALKPALEPITVARKPLSEKTVAENVLTHGTGGLNIDATRVPASTHACNCGDSIESKDPSHTSDHRTHTLGNQNPEGQIAQDASGNDPLSNVNGYAREGQPTQGSQDGYRPSVHSGGELAHASLKGDQEVAQQQLGEPELPFHYATVRDSHGHLSTCPNYTTPDIKLPTGRWPSNLIHNGSEEVVGLFPNTNGGSFKKARTERNGASLESWKNSSKGGGIAPDNYGDSGSAARFFYCAKASKKDRDEGLEGFVEKSKKVSVIQTKGVKNDGVWEDGKQVSFSKNNHPTVKPTDLMRYLCRLVTPPGGIVLDCFMGSGSTGKAAKLEGFSFIGIEREAEYVEIARARIEAVDSPMF